MKKTTLQQVADSCGISLAMASRVINGKPGVSGEVRKRVLTAVQTLGYDSGVGSRRHVAVLYPSVMDFRMNNYGCLLTNELYNVLNERGYWFHGLHSTELLKSYPFFAAVTLRPVREYSTFWSDEFDIPVISVNNPESPRENIRSVCSAEEEGMERAVDYLYSKGHRRIGLLLYDINDWCSARRIDGYRGSMRKWKLPDEEFLQVIPSGEPFYELLGKLIHAGVTALIAPGEGLGQRIVRALNLYRHRIPEDISLLTWEVPGVSDEWLPPLTTLGQDFRGLAGGVADILDALAAKRKAAGTLRIPYHFHERKSVAQL